MPTTLLSGKTAVRPISTTASCCASDITIQFTRAVPKSRPLVVIRAHPATGRSVHRERGGGRYAMTVPELEFAGPRIRGGEGSLTELAVVTLG